MLLAGKGHETYQVLKDRRFHLTTAKWHGKRRNFDTGGTPDNMTILIGDDAVIAERREPCKWAWRLEYDSRTLQGAICSLAARAGRRAQYVRRFAKGAVAAVCRARQVKLARSCKDTLAALQTLHPGLARSGAAR